MVGILPAVPWLFDVLANGGGTDFRLRLPNFTYFAGCFTQPFEFGIEYTLAPMQMLDYLASPLLAGYATYLMAIVYFIMICLFLSQ